jgi:CheY-like chemotaxis protein
LVVDDEADARALMRRLFEDSRATVLEASCAADALSLLRSERPAVLVSDIGMPGENGYGLIRHIRALPAEAGGATPAVALTAYARTEDRTQAILAGFQHHVAKPVEPSELIAMVASLCRRSVFNGGAACEIRRGTLPPAN